MKELQKDFLIALMGSKKDFKTAREQCWYRIPCKIPRVPQNVINGTLKYIAFYHTREFGNDAYKIIWFSEVRNISIVKRKVLFPKDDNLEKAQDDYYRIEFDTLHELRQPIVSHKPRRLFFIQTSLPKFINARDINELFIGDSNEESLWLKLKKQNIPAERQYMIYADQNVYLPDFAVFCKERIIDIECDGDEFQLSKERLKYDKIRSNALTKKGWNVLRFTAEDIEKNTDNTIKCIIDSINKFGGIQTEIKKEHMKFEEEGKEMSLLD